MNFGLDTELRFLQFQNEHRYKLLKNFYLLYLFIVAPTIFLYLTFYFILSEATLLYLLGLNIIILVVIVCGYRFTNKQNLTISSWVIMFVTLGGINLTSWTWGTDVPIVLANVLLITIAFIFLSRFATFWLTVTSILLWLVQYICQNVFKLYNPSLAKTGIVETLNLVAVPLLLMVFFGLLILFWNSQKILSDFQKKQLGLALTELKERQQSSGVMSQQISAVATQLNSAAVQQVNGSTQQVNTITEIGQSIEELSHISASISEISGQVNEAARAIDQQSRAIEETARVSVEQSDSGMNSIKETVNASSSVADQYQLLLASMQTLTAKSQDMRRILQLLTSIAAETHLLSLNAAIEAAGAGEHGSRFAVVAQETKNLALRSGNASKEVVDIINQIEDTINSTMQTVQEGFNTASQMQTASNGTRQVVEEMNSVVKTAYTQATAIRDSVKNVLDLAHIIKLATTQQQTASHLILQSVRELSAVAHQFAQNSNTLSNSADSLEGLSNELKVALVA